MTYRGQASTSEILTAEADLQVTAPVRETAAQALGALSRALTPVQTMCTLQHIQLLTQHRDWSVRHAGYLGLKYLCAAQQIQPPEMLSASQRMALGGLQVISSLQHSSAAM